MPASVDDDSKRDGLQERAARACSFAARGELSQAVVAVVELVIEAPELPCVAWLCEWLTPAVIRELGLDALKRPLVTLVQLWAVLPPALPRADARYANVLATAELAAQIRAQFPQESALYLAELVVRRRASDPALTLALAHEAVNRFSEDWRVLTSAATAERDAKRPDAALAYARRALDAMPFDGSPLHDAALAFAESGRREEAALLLRELLDEFPGYPLSSEAMQLLGSVKETR